MRLLAYFSAAHATLAILTTVSRVFDYRSRGSGLWPNLATYLFVDVVTLAAFPMLIGAILILAGWKKAGRNWLVAAQFTTLVLIAIALVCYVFGMRVAYVPVILFSMARSATIPLFMLGLLRIPSVKEYCNTPV